MTENQNASSENPFKDLFVGEPGASIDQQQGKQDNLTTQGNQGNQGNQETVTYQEQVQQFVQEAKNDINEGALLNNINDNNDQNKDDNKKKKQ